MTVFAMELFQHLLDAGEPFVLVVMIRGWHEACQFKISRREDARRKMRWVVNGLVNLDEASGTRACRS
jgi:hypothetical protein